MRKADEPAGLRIASGHGSIGGFLRRAEAIRSEQRRKRADADAAGRQAEQLASRQVKIEFAIDAHWLTAW